MLHALLDKQNAQDEAFAVGRESVGHAALRLRFAARIAAHATAFAACGFFAQITSLGRAFTIFRVSRLTVMTRRKSSMG